MYGRGAGAHGAPSIAASKQEATLITNRQAWLVAGVTLALLLGFYWLSPVLGPFLLAFLIAYMVDPLVDKLEARKLSRTQAVAVVFAVTLFVLTLLPLLLIPLIQSQLALLVRKIPQYFDWMQSTVLPWLEIRLGIDASLFDLDQIRTALAQHWEKVGGVASAVLSTVSNSSFAILGALANVLLVPVVTFYVLRDWDVMLARLRELLPRTVEPTVVRLASESDVVLSAFVRGQLTVMVALGTVYAVGLSLVGVDLGILIGFGAGLVSFVPYLGFIVGFVVAGIAAAIQFQDVWHVLLVGAVFGVGQLLESFWLTPTLVGDRVGLHPVLVIFSVMLGGYLFGFFGVLLALPLAAVIMVLLRFAHERYVTSNLYVAPADKPPTLP